VLSADRWWRGNSLFLLFWEALSRIPAKLNEVRQLVDHSMPLLSQLSVVLTVRFIVVLASEGPGPFRPIFLRS